MDNKESILKDKYFITAILFLIISITAAYFGIRYILNKPDSDSVTREQCHTEAPKVIDVSFLNDYAGLDSWWNENYSYFKQITLENKNLNVPLPIKCYITLQFNHSLYVEDKKTKADGGDLHLVYLENGAYQEIPIKLTDPNTSKTRIYFLPVKEIPKGGKDLSYFLYYGNPTSENLPLPSQEEDTLYAQNYKIYINRETNPKIFGQVNRHWFLKGQSLENDFRTIEYTVDIDESLVPDTTPTFEFTGTVMKGELEHMFKGEYYTEFNISDIPPGAYQLQTTIISKGETYKSTKSHIFISYPLYIAWTMDWEGTTVAQDQLDLISEFSKKHNFPITHFFNPRIYVTNEVSETDRTRLTQWIQNRQMNGDEAGMHLHMHNDMVSAAGVEVRTSPKWTNYLNNGHDVPCTAYTYEEFSQILTWGIMKFEEQGLGFPVSFRAGGWFANLETLRALEDKGFRIDSSGRERYSWGSNKLPGYWNLTSTTHPYYPSKSNQNSSAPPPNFALREFPDNGADSWFYKSDELISRFNKNYKQTFLDKPQVIVYLSHPHQISKDMEVLNPTFDYIEQYKVSLDQGPVTYVTLIQADTFLPKESF